MEKWVPRWNDPICDAVTAVRNMLGTNAVTYPVKGEMSFPMGAHRNLKWKFFCKSGRVNC